MAKRISQKIGRVRGCPCDIAFASIPELPWLNNWQPP